jgi:hypothetical protein
MSGSEAINPAGPQLLCAGKSPFPTGMNDIASWCLPQRRGMDDGAVMVLMLKRGEDK